MTRSTNCSRSLVTIEILCTCTCMYITHIRKPPMAEIEGKDLEMENAIYKHTGKPDIYSYNINCLTKK